MTFRHVLLNVIANTTQQGPVIEKNEVDLSSNVWSKNVAKAKEHEGQAQV